MSKKIKKTGQSIWKGSPQIIWPNPAQSRASSKVTLGFAGLCPAESWPPPKTEAPQPLWALFQILTSLASKYVFLISSHVSCVAAVFVASHHPTPLIKYFQKAVRCPQGHLYSKLTKPSSPSLSLQGKRSIPTILGTSPELPPARQCLSCTADLKLGTDVTSEVPKIGEDLPWLASARVCHLGQEYHDWVLQTLKGSG